MKQSMGGYPVLFCAYVDEEYLKQRFPKRYIYPTPYVLNGQAHYATKANNFRHMWIEKDKLLIGKSVPNIPQPFAKIIRTLPKERP